MKYRLLISLILSGTLIGTLPVSAKSIYNQTKQNIQVEVIDHSDMPGMELFADKGKQIKVIDLLKHGVRPISLQIHNKSNQVITISGQEIAHANPGVFVSVKELESMLYPTSMFDVGAHIATTIPYLYAAWSSLKGSAFRGYHARNNSIIGAVGIISSIPALSLWELGSVGIMTGVTVYNPTPENMFALSTGILAYKCKEFWFSNNIDTIEKQVLTTRDEITLHPGETYNTKLLVRKNIPGINVRISKVDWIENAPHRMKKKVLITLDSFYVSLLAATQ